MLMVGVVVKIERKVKVKVTQSAGLFATPWTIHSMEFSRPEYWSGQTFSSAGVLPKAGMELRSPALRADSLPAEPQGRRWPLIVDGAWGAVLSPQERRPCFSVTFLLL